MKMNRMREEHGTVILEGVFGVFVSIFVMMFLLSFGFYVYQKTIVRIVANEVAEEVAMTYKFRDLDDCSKITLDEVTSLGRYRYFLFSSQYDFINEKKATTLANVRLSQTSLAKANSMPTVQVDSISDDVGRMHYEVTLSQSYEFLMGDILKWIGLEKIDTISTTVYVEAVDVSNYLNTVKMTNYGLDKFQDVFPLLETVNKIIKMMKSIYDFFS